MSGKNHPSRSRQAEDYPKDRECSPQTRSREAGVAVEGALASNHPDAAKPSLLIILNPIPTDPASAEPNTAI